MVINVKDEIFITPNRKPESFYKEFYGKWIVKKYMQYSAFGITFYVKTLEECIQLQKEHDEMIDNNQFKEDLKYDISGRKEFIIQNNSYQKNKELLLLYEQNLALLNSKYGEQEPEFMEHVNRLIKKCEEILKRGYLVTNQLFLINYYTEDENFFEDDNYEED